MAIFRRKDRQNFNVLCKSGLLCSMLQLGFEFCSMTYTCKEAAHSNYKESEGLISNHLCTKVHKMLGDCRGPLYGTQHNSPVVYSMYCYEDVRQ